MRQPWTEGRGLRTTGRGGVEATIELPWRLLLQQARRSSEPFVSDLLMPLKHEVVSSTLVAVSIGSGEYR